MNTKVIALIINNKMKSLTDLPQPISINSFHQGVSGFMRIASANINRVVEGIKKGNEQKIAINQAGVIATECGAGVLLFDMKNADTKSPIKFKTISEVFQYIFSDDNNSSEKTSDMLLLARFANATWKAGQPFRGLSRMQKSNYIPASMLSQDELEKDFVQIRAAAKFMFEEMVIRAEKMGKTLDQLTNEEQLLMLQGMIQDLDFARRIGENLNNQYYIGIGQTPPQFLDNIPNLEQASTMIEDEAVRSYLQFEFDKALSTLQGLTDNDLKQLQWLGNKVIEAHMGHYRKDGIRPYFVHQIHLLRVMTEFFGVHNPLLAKILLLHDTREDKPEAYKAIKAEIEKMVKETETTADDIEFGKIRLGLRILTNDYDDPEMSTYLAKLRNPRAFFIKEKADYISDKPAGYYVEYNDEDIALFQLAKVIDIVGNGVESQSMPSAFKEKLKDKTDKYKAGFIDDSTHLKEHKTKFNVFYGLLLSSLGVN